MALIKCKECKKEISKDNKRCPNCGSKKNRSFLRGHPILSFFLLMLLIGFIEEVFSVNMSNSANQVNSNNVSSSVSANSDSDATHDDESQKSDSSTPDSEKSETVNSEYQDNQKEQAKTVSNWSYNKTHDKMRNLDYIYAENVSTDTNNVGPLDNSIPMNLILRNFNGENDVLLNIESVFSCVETSCIVKAKFDNGEIQNYEYSETNDGDSKTIFINDAKRFIKNLKKSKHVILEVPIFSNGEVQFNFDVNDLKWEF